MRYTLTNCILCEGEYVTAATAGHGHVDVLQWLRQQQPPCPWSKFVCSSAAGSGQLDVMKWLRSQNPPWYYLRLLIYWYTFLNVVMCVYYRIIAHGMSLCAWRQLTMGTTMSFSGFEAKKFLVRGTSTRALELQVWNTITHHSSLFFINTIFVMLTLSFLK